MSKPDFKITFGDLFSPIFVETELLFYKNTELEKVALSLRKIMIDTLSAQRRFFTQELIMKIRTHAVPIFLSNKDYLVQAMLTDESFFREYSGRRFTFKTNAEYLAAIEYELNEERVLKNLARLIDREAIQFFDFEGVEEKLMDFIEESIKTLSESNHTKESTDYEFQIHYNLENFLAHNGRMFSAYPNYLKDCGFIQNFQEEVKDHVFSIVIFVLRNEHSIVI